MLIITALNHAITGTLQLAAAAGRETGVGIAEAEDVVEEAPELRPFGDVDLRRKLRELAAAALFARPDERPVLPAPTPTPEKKDITLVCDAERSIRGSGTAAADAV